MITVREGWAEIASTPQAVGLVFSFAILLAGGMAVRELLRRRPTPNEAEQRRRRSIHESGRTGSGEIIDVSGQVVIYSYDIAGVRYTASQDLSALGNFLPAEPSRLIGPVAIKFVPRNPANSIVLCEEWSGLQTNHPKSGKD